ncbi:MAG: hypothetical protein QM718_14555 [Steroidobacteraceae bacterium]
MKAILGATAVCLTAFAVQAQATEPTDLDGAKTPAGKLVLDYFNMRFRDCQVDAAMDKYYSTKLVEHGWLGNGGVEPPRGAMGPPPGEKSGAAGGTGPAAAQGGAPTAAPGTAPQGAGAPPTGGKCQPIADIKKLIVQGDLVFVQAHGHSTKPNGDLLWILYRVKDGKIVEHWDTHDAIGAQANQQW